MAAPIEPELVQHMILFDAADIANERFNLEGFDETTGSDAFVASGQIYRADPLRSEKGGLCLSIDEAVVRALTPEQLEQIHRIGRESIKKAIVKNGDKFVGLIVGEAKQGHNYFDRFKPQDQTRLF